MCEIVKFLLNTVIIAISFFLGPASHLRDCHSHRWVCFIDTTKITVFCMTSLLLSIDLRQYCYFIMFYLKLSQNFYFSQILNLLICGIFEHNFFAADKAIPNLLSLSSTASTAIKFLLSNQAITEIRGFIRGRKIVVREIGTLI